MVLDVTEPIMGKLRSYTSTRDQNVPKAFCGVSLWEKQGEANNGNIAISATADRTRRYIVRSWCIPSVIERMRRHLEVMSELRSMLPGAREA